MKNTLGEKQHKLIYEFEGARNLFTAPLDITGLDGDNYDYFVCGTCRDALIGFKFNNDATANNRLYNMQGLVSTASASVNDATTLTQVFGSTTSGKPSIFKIKITGDATEEKYGSSLASINAAINVQSIYFKNTVDTLSSITLFDSTNRIANIDIEIYQVPKDASLKNYELMEIKTWSASSATQSFTGLSGDVDKEYVIVWKSTGSASVRLNNLSTAIYTQQGLKNNSGTLASASATSTSYLDGLYYNGELNLKAESGRKRLFSGSTAKTVSSQQGKTVCWVNDTVNEIIEINIVPSVSITATAYLYRRKSTQTIDPVPMKTVCEIPVSGDFSAGVTISGIEGDRIDGAIKVECLDFIGATNITMQANAITTNTTQMLKGATSTTSASSTSPTKPIICYGSANVNGSTTWIYPEIGQNRPCLNQQAYNENAIEFNGIWINDSVNEIISLLIQASSTTSVTGTIRISIPETSRQSTPSFIVTYN